VGNPVAASPSAMNIIEEEINGGYNCITAQNHIALIGQSSIVAAARSRWP
jgi:hypothetical protein